MREQIKLSWHFPSDIWVSASAAANSHIISHPTSNYSEGDNPLNQFSLNSTKTIAKKKKHPLKVKYSKHMLWIGNFISSYQIYQIDEVVLHRR